jgi:RND superfamily putative drug exporter
MGRRILGRRARIQHARIIEGEGAGKQRASAIARRPVLALLIGVVTLGVIAVPALSLRLGMPDDSTAAPDTTQRKAYDLVSAGFGPGFNAPLVVVVDTKAGGSAKVPADQVAQAIRGLDDVAVVAPATLNPAGDTALLTVIPESGPSAAETEDLVHAIRQLDGTVTGANVGHE